MIRTFRCVVCGTTYETAAQVEVLYGCRSRGCPGPARRVTK